MEQLQKFLTKNPQLMNYIGGEFQGPRNRQFLDNYNPSRGLVYGQVARSTTEDANLAIQAAHQAFPGWRSLKLEERGLILNRWAQLVAKHSEALSILESMDNGKPLRLAQSLDIPRCSKNLEYFANAFPQWTEEVYPAGNQGMNYTHRSPLGVVVTISPWNLPLYLLTWKIAPALMAGNTVVAKPSEVTPATATYFASLAREAGVPPGVFNLVHGMGQEVGSALVSHPLVKAVSFTGSTATGRQIAQSVAGSFKKYSLEMGGKNAILVFASSDLDKTAEACVRAAFQNQGQICLCGSRILMEESIANEFTNLLIQKTKKLKVGDPMDLGTDQGALVSKPHYEKVLQAIELAKKEGGHILTGGVAKHFDGALKDGYFIEPTIVDNLPASCATNQEEVFGPFTSLLRFRTQEEAVHLANGTAYGLAASVFTNDFKQAHRVAQDLEAGTVWVNAWMVRDLRTPFGGWKNSGVGREGGREALRFYTELKNIYLQISEN